MGNIEGFVHSKWYLESIFIYRGKLFKKQRNNYKIQIIQCDAIRIILKHYNYKRNGKIYIVGISNKNVMLISKNRMQSKEFTREQL